MLKISNTSHLAFEKTKALLIIRKPMIQLLASSAGLIISIIIFCVKPVDLQEGIEEFFTFFMLFTTLLILLYTIGLSEESTLDIKSRTVTRRKKIFNICFKQFHINWEEPYYLKYTVEYDSYQNISSIWLVATSTGTNNSYQLIRFFDKNSFIKFQELFNNQFPENKILEWHD